MKKPIVGIVGRILEDKEHEKYICSIESIRQTIIKMGGIPILILPTAEETQTKKDPMKLKPYKKKEKEDLFTILELCDAFLLPGGDHWYELDELVIKYAFEKDIPLLGICLGMQALGKVLSKERKRAYDNTKKNHSNIEHCQLDKDYVHLINIKKGTNLYSILKKAKIMVNSRHNYHIEDIEENYVNARGIDGIIEGIEVKEKKFIMGLQWHPESLIEKDKYAKKIFKAFLLSIHKNSQNFHEKKA